MVSVAEVVTGLARLGLDEFLAVHALRVHGDERHHAVAAVYVEGLRHGSESVRGIEVATVVAVVFQSPSQLVGIRSVGVLPVVVPEVVEVVDVCALCAQYLSEYAVLRHVERAHLKPVVAAVFQDHAVELLLLGEVHQLPALLQVHGRWHLVGHVLAVLQRTSCHDGVMLPVCGDIDEVNVVAAAEGLVALGARIDGCGRQSVLAQGLVELGCARLLKVAERHDLHAGEQGEVGHGVGTAHSQSHKTDAHRLHLRQRQPDHVLLSCGALGAVYHDFSFVPVPLRGGRMRLGACRQGPCREDGGKTHAE